MKKTLKKYGWPFPFLVGIAPLLAQEPFPRDSLIFGTSVSAFRILDIASWSEYGGQQTINGFLRYSFTGVLDERAFLYEHYYDHPWFPTVAEVSRWGRDPAMPPSQWLSANAPWRLGLASSLNIGGTLQTTRKHVISLLSDGRFAVLTKDIGSQPLLHQGPLLPSGLSTGGAISNGRELFVVAAPTGAPVPSSTYFVEVFALDMLAPTPSWRLLNHIVTPWGARGFCLGRDGKLYLAVIAAIHEIDSVTGAIETTHSVSWSSTTPPWPHDLLNGLAYDPWSDRAVMGDKSFSTKTTFVWSELHRQPTTWSLAYTSPWYYYSVAPGDGLYNFSFTNEQPFEIFGMGCPNGLGKEPRMGWQGLPRQAESFTLKLRDAEPNGLAMFWLGISDTFWAPVGTLPYEAAALGAPGCALLVSPDAPLPVSVTASGQATYQVSVPVDPALRSIEVFAQTISSSTANAFGYSSSDAVVIRVR